MRKFIGFIFIALILTIAASCFFLAENWAKLSFNSVLWPLDFRNYAFHNVPDHSLDQTPPAISPAPDYSGYTMDAMIAKIPPLEPGLVRSIQMPMNMGFEKFNEIRRRVEFSGLQKREIPYAIEIMSGVYDIETLFAKIDDPLILSKSGESYLLHLPVYIGPDATLIIRGKPPGTGKSPEPRLDFRMSSVSGAFIVNGGKLFVIDANVQGWNDKNDTPSIYETNKKFRPFLASWSASETYLGRSGFYNLGYAASKSYGITFSSSKAELKSDGNAPAPGGWLLESRFEGIYYGFYSYEAEHIAVINNVYANNIIYGIDPHDRSKHLLIAGNEAYGTIKKHGIIVSREVNDSWIVDNYSHHNHGSGFMLDRSSVRNLVAGNLAYRNGNDGLTLFESGDNVIRGNKFIMNGRSGLRLRNSSNVVAEKNMHLLNKGNGMQAYAMDISKTEDDRDFEEDPFSPHTSVTVRDSIFALNGAMFKFNDTDLVRLEKIHFLWYSPHMVRGDVDNMTYEIASGMRKPPYFVEIHQTKDADSRAETGNPADDDHDDHDDVEDSE